MKLFNFYRRILVHFRTINRLLRVNNRSEIVWNELIKLHKDSGWRFWRYDNEKYIETSFTTDNGVTLKFHYSIANEQLLFRTAILLEFDIESTNDVMVLSSHFNGLLAYGVVSVKIQQNCVEYSYSGDILRYLICPNTIYEDMKNHYMVAKDCHLAFSKMLNSGDDPVFVMAELINRTKQDKQFE